MERTAHIPFIIAIDGPAGSGKTTTARELAQRLGFLYIDTGAMYRAVAWAALERGIPLADADRICAMLPELEIDTRLVDGAQHTVLNGSDIETEIRSQRAAKAASDVSALPCVRVAMVELQRRAARNAGGAILEGRDIGTVVFPEAACKIFLVADAAARARRRQRQLAAQDAPADAAVIEREIAERDRNDMTRDHSPLRKAEDAIEVDTTDVTIEEQVSAIMDIVERRLRERGGARLS